MLLLPSFLDRFWFCLLYLIGLIGGLKIYFKSHKLLLHFSTNFYSVCFILIGRGLQNFYIELCCCCCCCCCCCFCNGAPEGASNLYFSHSNFFFFYVPSGASYFYFLTSRKLYHMKFAIFDVARCRMSATSLTFWFVFVFLFSFIYIFLIAGFSWRSVTIPLLRVYGIKISYTI